jgi:hypothetical protein
LAKRVLRRDPFLGGAGLANAGLAVGYSFLVLMTVGMVGLFVLGHSLLYQLARSPQPQIKFRNPDLPKKWVARQ